MAVKFANNVSTTLSSAINASQTTISVTDASGLPALSLAITCTLHLTQMIRLHARSRQGHCD